MPNFIVVMMVYGIIFGEYYAFMVIFIPSFYLKVIVFTYWKYGWITYLIGTEFTILFLFLNLAYFMV